MLRTTIAVVAFLTSLYASAAEPTDDETALFERLAVREQVLEIQTATATTTARKRSLLAYRMARRREIGFIPNPEGRLDEARSFDVALVALRQSLDESQTMSHELDRVRSERATLESALVDRALRSHPSFATDASEVEHVQQFPRPVRGTPVAVPGARRDGPTKVELRHDSVQILARLNDPVHAVAAGVVKRVEPMPQGGFAVVVAHDDGKTSIVSGLRDFAVKESERVSAGQTIGAAGRNLDGDDRCLARYEPPDPI